ncbi:arfGAP with SH3 domain, ANK repeat and PH domain-containing protein isoform X5 [Bacillus rossius redtenbacheri]|uniref:arfGAP with SH3 domain, ANK repeat and PH domain-containing protein isoform X5 n=1 Tax=Bacillus rossius redtenbacheri TaxID=93214 RepID=UPI002FDEE872
MPGLIRVHEFIDEARYDYNSPTTSTFVSRMPQCRQTIATLEETLDFDRDGLMKMKKAIKAVHNSGNSHVDNEMYLSRALEKLGSNALSKDQEPDIGAAFIKFAVVTKELSALMKTLMQNINNIVMFPLENLLKGDLRGVKGDLKRPFDKAWKDYEAKYAKIEKEKKQQAKEAGLIRSEVTPAEIADEMEKERRVFQLQMCEYLIKVNEIKTKKGIELLQHLVEYYHAQTK